MLSRATLQTLRQIAHGVSQQFGNNCEVVIHDLRHGQLDNSIIFIENGHVSSRKVGDGPSHIVLEAMKHNPETLEDKLCYLTRTHDGRILKSSTMYIRDEEGEVAAIFSINHDITALLAIEGSIRSLVQGLNGLAHIQGLSAKDIAERESGGDGTVLCHCFTGSAPLGETAWKPSRAILAAYRDVSPVLLSVSTIGSLEPLLAPKSTSGISP